MSTIPDFSEFVSTITVKDFELWTKEINADNGPFVTSFNKNDLTKTIFKLIGSSGVLTLKILSRYHEWLMKELSNQA